MAISNNFNAGINAGRIPQPGLSRQGINPNRQGLPERRALSPEEIAKRQEMSGVAPGKLKDVPPKALQELIAAIFSGGPSGEGLSNLSFSIRG